MKQAILLHLPDEARRSLWAHLLPTHPPSEQAAFVFANWDSAGGFHFLDWLPVPSEGFASQSELHFELTDDMRARAIKQAHDLGACLIEFHSHRTFWPAEFSPSDLLGFEEFVPHVWWRLKGRPYLAVVVAQRSFDGFAWISGPTNPERLDGIMVDGKAARGTRLSRLHIEQDEYRTT